MGSDFVHGLTVGVLLGPLAGKRSSWAENETPKAGTSFDFWRPLGRQGHGRDRPNRRNDGWSRVSRGLSHALSGRGSRGMLGKQQPSPAEIGSAAALIVRCTPAAVRQARRCGRGMQFTNAVALLLALKDRRTIALQPAARIAVEARSYDVGPIVMVKIAMRKTVYGQNSARSKTQDAKECGPRNILA